MNRLPLNTRKLILSMLVEGSSLRSINRTADVSINTVTKMLMDAGEVCVRLHDQLVQNVQSERVQVDEIWSFCYAKQRTVAAGGPLGSTEAGDMWTWTGLDPETKLLVAWHVGDRTMNSGKVFMADLRSRLAHKVHLSLTSMASMLRPSRMLSGPT